MRPSSTRSNTRHSSGLTSKSKVTDASPVDALVTQGWGRIAYNIVRSLGRHGLKVCVGFDEFRGMAALSRYRHASFFHSSFITHPTEFIRSLKEAVHRYRPKVYIPADQEALVVAKHQDDLGRLETEIPVAPFSTLRTLHKKDEVAVLANSLGIPTPDTLVPKSQSDILACLREWGEPIVLKRLSSSGARGVFYLRRDTVSGFLDTASASSGLRFGEFLVQRFVGGAGYGVSMLFNKGQLRAKFTHRRLREKFHTGGISTLRIGTENGTLEGYAERMLTHVKYHGVAMVEFKFEESSQQAWLLEVNPRFWGSLALAIQSGVDFPYLLYRMAVDGDVPSVLNYTKGVQVRWIMGDLFALAGHLRHLRLRDLRGTSAAEKGPVATGFDDFYWDDPFAFVGEVAFSVWKSLKMRNYSPDEMDLPVDHL